MVFKTLACFPLRPQTTVVFMENLGHVPSSLADVCCINFIFLLSEIRRETWECLVTLSIVVRISHHAFNTILIYFPLSTVQPYFLVLLLHAIVLIQAKHFL